MSRASGRRRWPGLVLGAGLAAALVQGGGRAQAQRAWVDLAVADLEVGGRVTEVLPHDLDGDGRKDLLVVRGREVLVYRQGKDGSWPAEANQRFRFHPSTVLFDLGDVDGDGRAELVLAQGDGVSCYRLQERGGRLLFGLRPERLVDCPAFLGRPIEDEVRRKELLRDLDGDGDLDLVLPRRDGFSIVERTGGPAGWAAPRVLGVPPHAVLNVGGDGLSGQLVASYWFADPRVAQFDAAGPAEVVLADEGTVRTFKAPAGGGPPLDAAGAWAIPDQRVFTMNVENPLELDFTMPLVLRDLDRDGRVDASSTHVGQGITRVFRNGADPAKAFATPVHTVRAKGVTFLSVYVDLDGDGLDDLVLPRTDKIGLWSILKALLTRSVPIDALVYYQRRDGPMFPDEPDVVRSFEVPLSIESGGEGGMRFGTTLVATLEGDHDGDGKKDLVYRKGDDELGFFRGTARTFAEEDATVTVRMKDVARYRFVLPIVEDLDGDKKDELILRYFSWDRDQDRLTIYHPR